MNHSDLRSLFLTWSKTSNTELGLLAYSFHLYSTTENWWLLSTEFLINQCWSHKCILNLCASFAYRRKTEYNKARKPPVPNCSSLSAQLVVAFICKKVLLSASAWKTLQVCIPSIGFEFNSTSVNYFFPPRKFNKQDSPHVQSLKTQHAILDTGLLILLHTGHEHAGKCGWANLCLVA